MMVEHGKAVASVSKKKNTDQTTRFRGVHRTKYGKYRARIRDPRRRALMCLGSYGTAEEAARAYDAAAVRLHGAARAITNLRQRTGDDGDATVESCSGQDGGGSAKKKKKARPEARTEFRGVHRRLSGKYVAQIGHSKNKAKTWLGNFDTAEDAARAYDAEAVKLHGAAAKTNFKVDDGIDAQAVGREKASRTGFRGVYQQQSGKYSARIWDSVKRAKLCLGTFDKAEDAASAYDAQAVRLHGERAITNFKQPLVDLNDFPELPALDFFSDSIIPGAQVDDVWTDLPRAELQPVDELLQDMDFTDVAA